MRYFLIIKLSISLILTLLSMPSQAQAFRDNYTCGINQGEPLKNPYGPYDFTNPNHAVKLPIVLGAHFQPYVEKLIRGHTQETPHGDIDYTLRAIPNYHRALYAISKLERNDKRNLPEGEIFKPKYYSAECYFKRAIYMQPRDSISFMLYAMHLQFSDNKKEARVMYENALRIDDKNPELHYNAGLFYLDIGMIEKAKYHADLAYSKGYPLSGLKIKLQEKLNAK